jgi:hypothetical protein
MTVCSATQYRLVSLDGSTMKGTKIMLGMLLSSSFSVQAFPISCRKKMLLSYRTAARAATGGGPSPPRAVARVRDDQPPLLLNEGIFAVEKPMNWTSSDVVSYLRVILERDARHRGCSLGNRRRPAIKVGHGGTLDPLATGVLVIGVGKGTKEMDGYVRFWYLRVVLYYGLLGCSWP